MEALWATILFSGFALEVIIRLYSYPNTALCGASEAGYIADYLVGIHDDLPERIDSVLRDGSPLIKIDFV